MAKQSFTTGQVLTAAEMTTLQANDYNQTVSAKVASYVLVATDAGTRITMSNVAATTITVNTSLFTAGDTLTITNIGAGVCTVTAGTATVSTGGSLAINQYESGTLYFTSTGVSIWNGANPGDITGVTAGNGLSGGGSSGTVSVAIDTAITVDKTTAQTLTNKTLTSPALTTPTISTLTTNGDLLYGTGSGAIDRKAIGSTGQVLTVAAGIPSWATPTASTPTWIGVQLFVDAAATISNTTSTNVAFTYAGNDPYSFHSTTVNNSRLTVPAGKAGYYLINASALWDNTSATGYREMTININGTQAMTIQKQGVATYQTPIQATFLRALSVGDYVQMQVYQNSGSGQVLHAFSYLGLQLLGV